jgi:type VI secretion system protein ImpE
VSNADDLLRAGDLEAARALLIEDAKKAPSDQGVRMFLFQLNCLMGDWDRARTQLRVLASLSPEAQMLAVNYNMAIDAELERAGAFSGKSPPALLVSSSPWARDLVAALAALSQGRTEEGVEKRDAAFNAAPDTPGDLDGVTFDWLADGDSRFGPSLEAIVAGHWGLIPFEAIESIKCSGPEDLRDLVWLPVELAFKTGQSKNAMLPVRYPGSDIHPDAAVRMARQTDWKDAPWGVEGVGQHEWSLSGGEDVGLLGIRHLVFR